MMQWPWYTLGKFCMGRGSTNTEHSTKSDLVSVNLSGDFVLLLQVYHPIAFRYNIHSWLKLWRRLD